jgi:hypothetical protein
VSLINKCDLFKNNPGLTIALYRLQSGVSLDDFQDFVTAFEDKPMDIKDRNFPGLSQLSEEFGFQALLAKLSAHRRSPGLSDAQTAECRSGISALEERAGQHEDQLAMWQSELFPALRHFEADLAHLASELEAFRDAKKTDTARPAIALPPPAAGPAVAAQPGRVESLIVGECPPLLDEFRGKRWVLLWCGSRDGFTAGEFHHRCDGRANTQTLIVDTDGSVFRGFTKTKTLIELANSMFLICSKCETNMLLCYQVKRLCYHADKYRTSSGEPPTSNNWNGDMDGREPSRHLMDTFATICVVAFPLKLKCSNRPSVPGRARQPATRPGR